jgi:hypothetical protein
MPIIPSANSSFTKNWEYRMKQPNAKKIYSVRKQIIESIFGIIKETFGYRRFMRRGLKKVSEEWEMAMCCYNIKRLFILIQKKYNLPEYIYL